MKIRMIRLLCIPESPLSFLSDTQWTFAILCSLAHMANGHGIPLHAHRTLCKVLFRSTLRPWLVLILGLFPVWFSSHSDLFPRTYGQRPRNTIACTSDIV